MLSSENNDLLTLIEPGSIMGNLLRHFWMPALLEEELTEPDGRGPQVPGQQTQGHQRFKREEERRARYWAVRGLDLGGVEELVKVRSLACYVRPMKCVNVRM